MPCLRRFAFRSSVVESVLYGHSLLGVPAAVPGFFIVGMIGKLADQEGAGDG